MRLVDLFVRTAILISAVVPAGMNAKSATAAPAAAASIAGSWKGPFLGTDFTFEFTPAASGWTGRYQSEKYHKWVDLRDVTVVDGTLRFSFDSKPPSVFAFKVDPTGKMLDGSATFGEHPALPLTLTRAS